MKTKDELTDEMLNIIERFDFEKVNAYMVLKDWKVNDRVLMEKQMRERALSMFEHLIPHYLVDEKWHAISNEYDGLTVIISAAGTLSLFFFIEMKNSYPI